jgi:hypothetical protein
MSFPRLALRTSKPPSKTEQPQNSKQQMNIAQGTPISMKKREIQFQEQMEEEMLGSF